MVFVSRDSRASLSNDFSATCANQSCSYSLEEIGELFDGPQPTIASENVHMNEKMDDGKHVSAEHVES